VFAPGEFSTNSRAFLNWYSICKHDLKMMIMKNTCLSLLALMLAISVSAQTKPHWAIKGGLNIANLNIEGFDNNDSRLGVHLGASAHIHLAPEWAVQPELLYSQEGGEIRNFYGNNSRAKFKNDYLNIPVMLQYMFDNGFRIEAGPQLGLLVRSKVEDQNGAEDDAKDVFKSTNVALGLGLNYLSYSGLGVGGRYNLGLSNIGEGSRKVKDNTFQISVFYMLDPAHKRTSR
jgi:hypothetical protein